MVYMYHSFLIHSSADGRLGCFHVLAMINSAAMSIGVHVSLSDLVSCVSFSKAVSITTTEMHFKYLSLHTWCSELKPFNSNSFCHCFYIFALCLQVPKLALCLKVACCFWGCVYLTLGNRAAVSSGLRS